MGRFIILVSLGKLDNNYCSKLWISYLCDSVAFLQSYLHLLWLLYVRYKLCIMHVAQALMNYIVHFAMKQICCSINVYDRIIMPTYIIAGVHRLLSIDLVIASIDKWEWIVCVHVCVCVCTIWSYAYCYLTLLLFLSIANNNIYVFIISSMSLYVGAVRTLVLTLIYGWLWFQSLQFFQLIK